MKWLGVKFEMEEKYDSTKQKDFAGTRFGGG